MKRLVLTALLMGSAISPAAAQPAPTSVVTRPVTVEYYYRIKWGSADEFKRLYERNHAPLMREMEKLGYVTRMEVEEPFTHLAGGPRWDLRVTVEFRDAASAIVVGGAFDQAFEAAKARLYPDKSTFAAEEARRFSLLEDHWDVIVTPVAPAP